MKKQLKLELKIFADDLAKKYSNTNRKKNFNNEYFYVEEITLLTGYTAMITFGKSSGDKALAVVWYIEAGTGSFFQYFFPKDEHIEAFGNKVYDKYFEILNYNYLQDDEEIK